MRKLILSTITLAAIAGTGSVSPAQAQPQVAPIGVQVQTVQYYEPGWREREEWRRRREFELHRREEWRRHAFWRHEEARREREFEGAPRPYYYGPRE